MENTFKILLKLFCCRTRTGTFSSRTFSTPTKLIAAILSIIENIVDIFRLSFHRLYLALYIGHLPLTCKRRVLLCYLETLVLKLRVLLFGPIKGGTQTPKGFCVCFFFVLGCLFATLKFVSCIRVCIHSGDEKESILLIN